MTNRADSTAYLTLDKFMANEFGRQNRALVDSKTGNGDINKHSASSSSGILPSSVCGLYSPCDKHLENNRMLYSDNFTNVDQERCRKHSSTVSHQKIPKVDTRKHTRSGIDTDPCRKYSREDRDSSESAENIRSGYSDVFLTAGEEFKATKCDKKGKSLCTTMKTQAARSIRKKSDIMMDSFTGTAGHPPLYNFSKMSAKHSTESSVPYPKQKKEATDGRVLNSSVFIGSVYIKKANFYIRSPKK